MELVILLFYFQNLLTGLFIESISLCTSSTCSLASCYSFSSFSKFEEADASSGLGAGICLAFFGFLACGGSEDWCWGPCWGKKKPRILLGEERGTASSENSDFFIFKFYFEIYIKRNLQNSTKWSCVIFSHFPTKITFLYNDSSIFK